jgi:hypothetical protein
VNRAPEPAGIGGWLILPALGLAISPIWQGIRLVRDIIPSLNPSLLGSLSDPTSNNYSALWVPTILFEAVSDVLLFALTLWLAYLFFFRKSVFVPRLYVIWIASHLVMQTVDWLLTMNLPLAGEHPNSGVPADLRRSIIGAVIWIPYFIRSVRVKNTFINPAADNKI